MDVYPSFARVCFTFYMANSVLVCYLPVLKSRCRFSPCFPAIPIGKPTNNINTLYGVSVVSIHYKDVKFCNCCSKVMSRKE